VLRHLAGRPAGTLASVKAKPAAQPAPAQPAKTESKPDLMEMFKGFMK
jgi:hypothetical protein